MEIRKFGMALSKLMSESRNIRSISDAEERILHHLWNTSDLPQNVLYLLRNIPTVGAYVVSKHIGNGTFTDFMIPSSLDVIKKTQQGNITRIPEEFPNIPPFKEHRYYTLFPIISDNFTLYILMIESPKPLSKLYINFTEEYLSQAKRVLERTTFSYVINISKNAYTSVSNLLVEKNQHNRFMEHILKIFISENIPIAISIYGRDKDKLNGKAMIKNQHVSFSVLPTNMLLSYLMKFEKRGISLIKRWDIPSDVLSMLTNTVEDKVLKAYLSNVSYGLIGGIASQNNEHFIMGIFTTKPTVPFTETDARTLKNSLSILKMAIKRGKLAQIADRERTFLEGISGIFKQMIQQSGEESYMWKAITRIVRNFKDIKGLYVITKGVTIPLVENKSIPSVEDLLYRLNKAYTVRINNLMATKINIPDMTIVVIHQGEITPLEREAIKSLFRNVSTVKDYISDSELYTATIRRLSMLLPTAMEEMGIEPKGHTQAMLNLASLLKDKIEIDYLYLRMAIVFHDIGKLYIDPDILLTRGPLTQEQWKVIKEHPIYSQEFLSAFKTIPTDVINAVLYHHENFDGSGYPYGLMGEEIPILARIIRVLDTFTVMTRPRVYKEATSVKEAIKHLQEYSGVYYDPNIV